MVFTGFSMCFIDVPWISSISPWCSSVCPCVHRFFHDFQRWKPGETDESHGKIDEKHGKADENLGEIDEIHWKIDDRLGKKVKTIKRSKAKTNAKSQKPKAKPPGQKNNIYRKKKNSQIKLPSLRSYVSRFSWLGIRTSSWRGGNKKQSFTKLQSLWD